VKTKRGIAQFSGIFDSAFRRHAASCNGGIGKIAALPSFEKVCYFCRWLLVGKYVKAATSPIPKNVVRYGRTAKSKKAKIAKIETMII
jgi:hypothetical protein